MRMFFFGFCVGWFFGAVAMWFYFAKAHMLRTREEYYAAHPEQRPKEDK